MKLTLMLCLALVATGVLAMPAKETIDHELEEMVRAMVEEADARTAREWSRKHQASTTADAHKDSGSSPDAESFDFGAAESDFSDALASFLDGNKRELERENKKNKKNKMKKSLNGKQPNIIFLLADDLGWNDVSWHNDQVISPEMQKLVDDGIQLENSYVQSVCSPSRHSIMTGMYPIHSGMQHGVVLADHPECSPHDQRFVPQELSDLGYATHMVGKWHLGFCNWECTPTYRGFDTFYGFYQGYIDHYSHMYGAGYDWRDNEDVVKDNKGTYATDLINQRAIEILKEKDGSEPFYMYVSYNNVHIPLEVPQRFYDMYADRTDIDDHRKTYLGMVTSMDESIGELVQTLKDQGLYDNTIIVFSSDNGGEKGSSNNAPLRGGKASLWEGGMKAASFIHSPLLPDSMKGYKADQLIHATDWLPTFVKMAGGTPRAGLDGVDQTDFILNGGDSNRDTIIHNIDDVFPYIFGRKAIRKGDWKLIQGFPGFVDGRDTNVEFTHRMAEYQKRGNVTKRGDYSFSRAEYMQMFGIIRDMETNNFLFNIKDDPNETTDLAADMPDKVQELADLLTAAEPGMVPVPKAALRPEPRANPALYDDTWSPGWCEVH